MKKKLKDKFERKLITTEEISNEIAEENGFDKKTLWFMYEQFEARQLEYIMNGVKLKGLLGKTEHRIYKPREVVGFNGDISLLPHRHKVKIDFPERFSNVYEKHEYYDLFLSNENNELEIHITNDTPKIKEKGATYWDCLKVLADVLWKGETIITVENKEELKELMQKINDFVSESREKELKRKIKENKEAKILRKLRKELKILQVLKQNLTSGRILIINNEVEEDKTREEV